MNQVDVAVIQAEIDYIKLMYPEHPGALTLPLKLELAAQRRRKAVRERWDAIPDGIRATAIHEAMRLAQERKKEKK